MTERIAKGLAGVVVEETAISDVQPRGGLSYRGRAIEDLVGLPFHKVAALVVTGSEDNAWGELLAQFANLSPRETTLVLSMPEELHPMRVIQAVASSLVAPECDVGLGEANPGFAIAAKLPAVIATHLRREPVAMDADLDYGTRFLTAIGKQPEPGLVDAFNTAQILQIEHSLNAGTFAARVVASTLAPVSAAITAGFGALSGPLHGGADQAVLDIADTLADTHVARRHVERMLEKGEKLPGMGHREYRVRDPRAKILQGLLQELLQDDTGRLGERVGLQATYEVLTTMEKTFRDQMQAKGKPLHANVEFYKGLVYRAAGLPNRFFTTGFAMARVFGYIAHFIESRRDNRIYRPAARYVAPVCVEEGTA